ncbi:helix-turn-helix transcriptional regulator [Kiloniella majae]|uniref:helix-turn-helix transcriptional regulator n=1 Tax=Kiloniella majae TaxID=1938558 RepID=UPI000A277A9F|nr:sigma-70 family RNA polymerase sigma factor [Kiloniella majae]
MLTLEQAVSFNHIDKFTNFAKANEIPFYWQKQTENFVYTFDKMPEGCIEGYYGPDLDLYCPGAWAFRSRIWPVFSFTQARTSRFFKSYDPQDLSLNFWKSHGINDFLCVLSGTPGLASFSFFGFKDIIDNPMDIALPYIHLTHQMDRWLPNHQELKPYSRQFSALSPSEKRTIALQIEQPRLSFKELALLLGISENTLKVRQKRIAKKLGTSYVGAILLSVRSREFMYPE